MSERSVLIAVGFALVMLGLWVGIDLFTRVPGAQPTPLLAFDPAQVDRLEVAAHGRRAWVERDTWFGSPIWVVRWGQGGPDQSWPAEESRVRAALRVLATTPLEKGESVELASATLTLRTIDGQVHTVRFSDRPIAGKIGVQIESGARRATGLTDAALFDAFVRTGLMAWRDEHAMLSPGVGPSRVFVSAGDRSLSLARREGRWTLLDPVPVPAEPEQAGEFAKNVSGLLASRFIDEMAISDERAGFSQPLARVEAEHDLRIGREGGQDMRLVRQVMTVGGPTDLSGQSVYGLVEWTVIGADGSTQALAGPVVVAVATESLNRLTTHPEPLIARTSTSALPGSFQRVELALGARRVRLERFGTGWAFRGQALLPGDSEAIESLCRLLAQRPADEVALGNTPADVAPLDARVTGGGASLQVQLFATSQPAGLWVQDGMVQRFHARLGDLAVQLASIVERLGNEP
ncbi:MAG: hypothetical protein KJZ65_13470 [Phycisphaerales bacterium]|nr:hypothetical protein [Phycisphaerales bacterium]